MLASATVMYGCRHRTTRKRKPDETDKEVEQVLQTIESDAIGPFWFQKSTTFQVHGALVHVGLQQRERLELQELLRTGFVTPEFLRDILVPLNDESSSVPRLRMYNWAVTNYAKGKGITTCVTDKDGLVKYIDPSISYNSTLKKLHRPLFDPYRRGTLLFFHVEVLAGHGADAPKQEEQDPTTEPKHELAKQEISMAKHHTTVGQLLFVKWCMDNGVDRYVEAHKDEIRNHLNETAKQRATKGKKRVKELTEATCKYARVIPDSKRQKTE